MKVLIIEDEAPAARRLITLIKEYDSTIEVVDTIDTVEASVKWLNNHEQPSLIFMDIQLADGLSFEIFNKVKINTPIIFITAYDEYSIKAFKVNSIDYLLKPLDKDSFNAAMEKYKSLKNIYSDESSLNFSDLLANISGKKHYKSRFLVKLGERLISVNVDNIAYFTTEDKLTFLITKENKKYPMDYSLDDLDTMVDPEIFFRLNRQFLSKIASIQSIHQYFNGKLKLTLNPMINKDVIVSREKAGPFKQWLEM